MDKEVYFSYEKKELSFEEDYLVFELGELHPLEDNEGYEAVIPNVANCVDLWIHIDDDGEIMNQELFVDLGPLRGGKLKYEG